MTSNNASSLLATVVPLEVFAPHYYRFRTIHRLLVKITLPYLFFIALLGLITNSLTVVLLSKNSATKNLKNKWTLIALGMYDDEKEEETPFRVLALSDLLFNTALLARGVHDVVKANSDRFCLIISFLSHLAELLSACYTVAFTVQRYYAIHYPFEAAVHRRSSPILSLLLIFVLSSVFCLLLSRHNRYEDCHEELYLGWFVADATLSFGLPCVMILIFNTLIINYIRQYSCAPISVRSTRRALQSGETIVITTNIHSDGSETIEMRSQREKKSSEEGNQQACQLLASWVSAPRCPFDRRSASL